METIYSQKNWRWAFIIVSFLIIVLMPAISKDYGQSGDEWLQIEYGQDVYNYFKHDNPQALDYSNQNAQHESQEKYGGLFDYSMHLIQKAVPAYHILEVRHFFNALLGALFMIFTGLIARRLTRRWDVAFLSLLFMIMAPRIFGESMNNPKDIPFGAGFVIGIYFFLALLQDYNKKPWLNIVALALGFGLAFGVRSAGGIIQIMYLGVIGIAYLFTDKEARRVYFENKNKVLKKVVGFTVLGLAIGYIIALSCWPWGLQSPVGNPIISLQGMANRATAISVLFNGQYMSNQEMPWFYEFKWILITNPLIIVTGYFLFVGLLLKIRKQYGGWFVPGIILFGALFPLLYMIYKNSTVYDTWRHVFFLYSFWAIAAAVGWVTLAEMVTKFKFKSVPALLFLPVLGLIPYVAWAIKNHPNQTVYFNELVGGLPGAYNVYETDYYQNSGKQAADWVKKNAEPKADGSKIVVMSNLSGFWYYFDRDTSKFFANYVRYNERANKDWDYYVTYSRYVPVEQIEAGAWPPPNTVYQVKVDGVPICIVLKRTSKVSMEANEALQKNDFPTAIVRYAEYIKTDAGDENVWANYAIALASVGNLDEGIKAMDKATQLNPSRIDLFQTLAKMYQMKGDNAGAQKAINAANAIISKRQ